MEHVETPPETGTAASVSPDSVSLRQRWTLRAAVIRLLEACVQRLQRPHATSVIALLPPPTTWDSETAQGANDSVTGRARSAWQMLGVILVLVAAGTTAWLAWRRIEALEQRHEEAVSMTLATVEQEVANQRTSLEMLRTHVDTLAAQVTATPRTASGEAPLELSALKHHVEELETTIGAYGVLFGKQQQEVAAHTEQLTTQDATLRALTTTSRPASMSTSAKARKRTARSTPPTLETDAEGAASHSGRPMITLPANLGAWSLGVRTPEP